ncbi:MAG: DUF4282 domain-containing protein [Bacteroidota bacterium]|nr:DUF4282 domain-containing protein [Bacteroidota bacterium]
MNDYLAFRKMITPVILKVVFWIAVLINTIYAIVMMFQNQFWIGLVSLLLGPFVIRVFFELILVTFQINESLADIRQNTKEKA